MRRIISIGALALTCFSGASVQAGQGYTQREETSRTDTTQSRPGVYSSEREAPKDTKEHNLRTELVGIKPQLGTLLFKSPLSGDTESRGAAGVTVDWNLTRMFTDSSDFYVGPSTGAIYSHVGSANANFFGAGGGAGGSNVLLIPANLKVGYNLSDSSRISLHGGGNVLYNSIANTFNLGASSATAGSDWTVYPNVGADFEFGKELALMIRPDFTLTPGDELFTGTVALAIPLG